MVEVAEHRLVVTEGGDRFLHEALDSGVVERQRVEPVDKTSVTPGQAVRLILDRRGSLVRPASATAR